MNRLVRRVLLATLLGVVVYALFAVSSGVRQLGASLAHFHAGAFVLALALATLNYLLRFGKWQYYLRELGLRAIPRLDSLLVFLTGFVLTVTPGKVGEVFKSAVLAKTHGIAVERTAPIIIADRLTDVIGIVLLILLGGAMFPKGLPWAIAGVAAVSIGLFFIWWQRPALGLCHHFERRGGRLARFVPQLRAALGSLRLLAHPRVLVVPTLLSVCAWGAEGAALYVVLRGFEQSVGLGLSIVVYSSATLAGALVPVPGGLGVVESLLRTGLLEWGQVAPAASTAAMILVRLATLWWAVLVGFGALLVLRVRFRSALDGAARAVVPDAAGSGIS